MERGERGEPARDTVANLVLAWGPASHRAVIEAEHSGEAPLRPSQEIKTEAEFWLGHGSGDHSRRSGGGSFLAPCKSRNPLTRATVSYACAQPISIGCIRFGSAITLKQSGAPLATRSKRSRSLRCRRPEGVGGSRPSTGWRRQNMAQALMFQAVRRTLLSNRCRAVAEPRRTKFADRVGTLDTEPR